MTFALLAAVANFSGDLVEAKRNTLLVKENYEAMGDRRGILRSQSDLAHFLRREGHIDEAEAYLPAGYRRLAGVWPACRRRPPGRVFCLYRCGPR